MVQEEFFSCLDHVLLLNELLQHFRETGEKVFIVGHDLGGSVAQLFVARFPEAVDALVLINSPYIGNDLRPIPTHWGGWWGYRVLKRLLMQAETLDSEMRNALSIPWKHLVSRQPLVKAIEAWQESWPGHYERLYWKKELQIVKRPVLLLWGEKDTIHSPQVRMDYLRVLHDAEFYTHDQSGHWPYLEQTQWVADKVKRFLFNNAFEEEPLSVQKSLSQ